MANEYLEVKINGKQADVATADSLPVAFDYKLEDNKDFQKKSGSSAVDIEFPDTLNNRQIFNDFSNPSSEDNTPDGEHRKLRDIEILYKGSELLVGKEQLQAATHNDKPLGYKVSAFGQNSDWALLLKETTVFDFVTPHTHLFDVATQIASWQFDGNSEVNDFVYAPVVTRDMDPDLSDFPATMFAPSISLYWIIYRAFQSIGYNLQSDYMDTPDFRRRVMPFTWFDFRRLDPEFNERFLFRIKQIGDYRWEYGSGSSASTGWNRFGRDNGQTGVRDYFVDNDFHSGGFDNGPVQPGNVDWRGVPLLPPHHLIRFEPNVPTATVGNVTFRVYFSFEMQFEVIGGAFMALTFGAVPNVGPTLGVIIPQVIATPTTPAINNFGPADADSFGEFQTFTGFIDLPFTAAVTRYDLFFGKTWDASGGGNPKIECTVRNLQVWNDEIFRDLGSVVNFKEMSALKKHKFMDCLAGAFDYGDFQVQSDSGSKTVRIEPYFKHSLDDDPSTTQGGYMNGNKLNWTNKQDLSKVNTLELMSDLSEIQIFQAKQDDQDGVQKVYREKFGQDVGAAHYELPDRFKSGEKKNENRFFSPMMHYRLKEMARIHSYASVPQACVMIEENISNTSERTARALFLPKLCYYKGLQVQDWRYNGATLADYPFMFQVNYDDGGEADPIISYCDELIGSEGSPLVIGRGLMKRFYLQRMAIVRNGQRYNQAYFDLNQNDFQNWLHREFIHIDGNNWILKQITGFNTIAQETTACVLDKWTPIKPADLAACFPSAASIDTGLPIPNTQDIKYVRRLCLTSEILKAITNDG